MKLACLLTSPYDILNREVDMQGFSQSPQSPFGLVISAERKTALAETSSALITDLVNSHRLVVLRNISTPTDEEMIRFAKSLGEVLEWEFGAINELKMDPSAKNYLYTESAVPMHWDGAFLGKIPRFIFFHCTVAPAADSGGETIFCDTTRVLKDIAPEELLAWRRVSITYSTEKVVHYGGQFQSPLLGKHPETGAEIIRYAEPVRDLNPVRLDIDGFDEQASEALIERMRSLLYAPSACYSHQWQDGDILIADNNACLHGRRAILKSSPRHLRRINIL
jgi:alpha-ketoglutarate-dependent taurine dioxygenase